MRARLLAVLLLAAGSGGCSSGAASLDTARATTVLAAEIAAARPFVHFVKDMADTDDAAESGIYETLVHAGILRRFAAASPLGSGLQTHYRLTAQGAALEPGWRKEERGVYEIPVGRLRLERVTAVEMLAPGHAVVTYVYTIDLNAMGQLLRRAVEPRSNYFDPLESRERDIHTSTVPATAVAELRRYDDGWKSESWAP